MLFGVWTCVGPKKLTKLHGGAHWRNLATTIELSVFGSPTKMAEAIEMPFGVWMSRTKHVLDGVQIVACQWAILGERTCPDMPDDILS